MTTEYFLQEGDNVTDVARALIDQAAEPDDVHWMPRPDTIGGGVFVLRDATIAERVQAKLRADAEEAARVAADERARHAAEEEDDEDEGDDTADETPAEPGKPLTAAQKRAAKKAAAAKAAAEQTTETPGTPGVASPAEAPAEGGRE